MMFARLFALALTTVLIRVSTLGACSCQALTICDRLERTSVILLGEVVEGGVAPGDDHWNGKAIRARIKILEVFRGLPKNTQHVDVDLHFWPGMCAPNPYLRGEQVLVFTEFDDKKRTLSDGGCTQSRSGRWLAEELETVRKYFRGAMETEIMGRIAPNTHADLVEYVLSTKETLPLAGAKVTAQGQWKKYQAISDKDGRYSISGLPGGHYSLGAELEGFENREPPLAVHVKERGCAVQNLGVWTRNSAMGFVFDQRGNPVAGLSLSLERKGIKKYHRHTAKTTLNGAFRFEKIDPGDYSLVVSPGGETADSPYPKTVSATFFEVGPTSAIQGLILKVPVAIPTRNIRIHVTARNGQPQTTGYMTCSQEGRETQGHGMSIGLVPKREGAICRALVDRPYRIRLERTTGDFSGVLATPLEAIVSPGREDLDIHLKVP